MILLEGNSGCLRVHPKNPRYFTNNSGRAIYLTGSHVWSSLQEHKSVKPFNYEAYLKWLQEHNHNFTRLWFHECGFKAEWIHGWSEDAKTVYPLAYERTGPGIALDGEPKFDLTKFNQEYFNRLRERVKLAEEHGIYVSIMLFQGWEIFAGQRRKFPSWNAHPFNKHNNINGIDGDPKNTGNGFAIHTLEIPAVTEIQKNYVRKVIDTVNEFDNIMYEISNESDMITTEWQYYFINYIHEYEKKKPKQHPVGMTFQYGPQKGTNENLFKSPADWISPNPEAENEYDYRYNPPPADGAKVVLLDTDHLWGIGGDAAWVWKSFTRGYNPIFMDPYDTGYVGPPDSGLVNRGKIDQDWESVRIAMGQTRMFADRIDLGNMVPHPELVLTGYCVGYCLANPGFEYLIYRPPELPRKIQVDLTTAEGDFLVEWYNPDTGISIEAKSVIGGEKRIFISPFNGSSVLYIKKIYR